MQSRLLIDATEAGNGDYKRSEGWGHAKPLWQLKVVSIRAGAGTITLRADRIGFTPSGITLRVGRRNTLILIADDVTHSLRIDEPAIDLVALPGESSDVTIEPKTAGNNSGRCGVYCGPNHGKMIVKVHVVNEQY